MLSKIVKLNGTHELFMNMYVVVVVVGQRYYYIDKRNGQRIWSKTPCLTIRKDAVRRHSKFTFATAV